MTAIQPRPEAHLELSTENLPASPETELIRLALERNLDVDKLEKLVALRFEMQTRQARMDFFAALAAFQRECPPIRHEKEAKIATKAGGSYAYTYAELDVIARKVNPILAKHGLSYRWNTTIEGATLACECIVSHVAGHFESSRFVVPVESASAMSPQQKYGAASTFAQRRSLSLALGLTTTDDDTDGAQVDETPIDDDQATAIHDLLAEKGFDGDRLTRFLRYMDAPSVEKIRAADYQKAVTALQQVKAK